MLVIYRDKDGKIKHLENDESPFFIVFKYEEKECLEENGVPSFWLLPNTDDNEEIQIFANDSVDYMFDTIKDKFEDTLGEEVINDEEI